MLIDVIVYFIEYTRLERKEAKKEEDTEDGFTLFKKPKSKSEPKKRFGQSDEKQDTAESESKSFGNSTISNSARDWLNMPKRCDWLWM